MPGRNIVVLFLICLLLGFWTPISQYLLKTETAFTYDNLLIVQSSEDAKR